MACCEDPNTHVACLSFDMAWYGMILFHIVFQIGGRAKVKWYVWSGELRHTPLVAKWHRQIVMILCMSGAAAVLSGALLPPDLLVTWSTMVHWILGCTQGSSAWPCASLGLQRLWKEFKGALFLQVSWILDYPGQKWDTWNSKAHPTVLKELVFSDETHHFTALYQSFPCWKWKQKSQPTVAATCESVKAVTDQTCPDILHWILHTTGPQPMSTTVAPFHWPIQREGVCFSSWATPNGLVWGSSLHEGNRRNMSPCHTFAGFG